MNRAIVRQSVNLGDLERFNPVTFNVNANLVTLHFAFGTIDLQLAEWTLLRKYAEKAGF